MSWRQESVPVHVFSSGFSNAPAPSEAAVSSQPHSVQYALQEQALCSSAQQHASAMLDSSACPRKLQYLTKTERQFTFSQQSTLDALLSPVTIDSDHNSLTQNRLISEIDALLSNRSALATAASSSSSEPSVDPEQQSSCRQETPFTADGHPAFDAFLMDLSTPNTYQKDIAPISSSSVSVESLEKRNSSNFSVGEPLSIQQLPGNDAFFRLPPRRVHHSCDTCGKRFAEISNLSKHIRTVHLKIREHRCNVCGIAFAAKCNLFKHHRSVHLRLRPFQCKRCPSAFSERNKLMKHQSTVHENARPYGCNQCTTRFGQKSDLRRHTAVVHEGCRPHKCLQCAKSFGRKSSLLQHAQRVHKMSLKEATAAVEKSQSIL